MKLLTKLAPPPYRIGEAPANPDLVCYEIELNIKKLKLETSIHVENGLIALILLEKTIVGILEKGLYSLRWVLPSGTSAASLAQMRVIYFSCQNFNRMRWGTPTPVAAQNATGEFTALRAHGSYTFHLHNPKTLWRHIPAGTQQMTTSQFSDMLRPIILNVFTAEMMNPNNNFDAKLNPDSLSHIIFENLSQNFRQFGVQLDQFLIQHISVAG